MVIIEKQDTRYAAICDYESGDEQEEWCDVEGVNIEGIYPYMDCPLQLCNKHLIFLKEALDKHLTTG